MEQKGNSVTPLIRSIRLLRISCKRRGLGLLLVLTVFAGLPTGGTSFAANDASGTPSSIPQVQPAPEIETLLLKVEQQITAGHTVTPTGDAAIDTWREVVERSVVAPTSPGVRKALADFEAHMRERGDDEFKNGNMAASSDLILFAHLATGLLGQSPSVPGSPAASPQPVQDGNPAPKSADSSTAPPSVRAVLPDSNQASVAPAAPATPQPGINAARNPEANVTEPPRPAAVPTLGPSPATGSLAMARETTKDQQTATLYARRGDEMLALKDISAARKYYEYSANAGNAHAASALARTYDPASSTQLGVVGLQPDLAKAAAWYQRAAELGDTDSATRLRALKAEADK